MSFRDVLYNIVPIVNSMILCTSKFVKRVNHVNYSYQTHTHTETSTETQNNGTHRSFKSCWMHIMYITLIVVMVS